MSAPIKILGVGNVWRGDDGVGPFIAGQLANRLPELTIRSCNGEITGLLGEFEHCNELLLIDAIDAASANLRPGSVLRLDAGDPALTQSGLRASSSHVLGVMEALTLARTLDLLPDKCAVIGVAGKRFEHRQELSPPVQRAAETLVEDLSREYDHA